MNKKLSTYLVCIFALFLICSCKSTDVSKTETELFSTDWKESVFSEDSQLGYFFTTNELGQFSMIEGEFKKSGGYEDSPFGFVFGYTADKEGILSDYIRFEITTSGEYAAYCCKGSTYIDLIEKNDKNTAYMNKSSLIVSGYNSVNKIKIQKKSNAQYDLFINGSLVKTIDVPSGFGNSDGVMAFFSVGKANQEKFPTNPVKVTYRITDYTPVIGEAK